jgi:hypothetical protein
MKPNKLLTFLLLAILAVGRLLERCGDGVCCVGFGCQQPGQFFKTRRSVPGTTLPNSKRNFGRQTYSWGTLGVYRGIVLYISPDMDGHIVRVHWGYIGGIVLYISPDIYLLP